MSRNNSGFTREEISLFFYELKSKFWSGIRSPVGVLYITLMLGGVGWATWGIPSFNESETSPETYGIYVIGFVVTVLLDAIVIWKKTGDDNRYEGAIANIFIIFSFALVFCASYFSMKTFHVEPNKTRAWEWKNFAMIWLSFVFICAIVMSIVLTGIDSQIPTISVLDKPTNAIRDK